MKFFCLQTSVAPFCSTNVILLIFKASSFSNVALRIAVENSAVVKVIQDWFGEVGFGEVLIQFKHTVSEVSLFSMLRNWMTLLVTVMRN